MVKSVLEYLENSEARFPDKKAFVKNAPSLYIPNPTSKLSVLFSENLENCRNTQKEFFRIVDIAQNKKRAILK